MLKLKVSARSFRDLEREIARASAFAQRLFERSSLHMQMRNLMMKTWATNFRQEGGRYGQWPALSDSWTIPDRLAGGYGAGPKLVRTGQLGAHFRGQTEKADLGVNSVRWQFFSKNNAWVLTHQFGMPNPIKGAAPIPARPMFGLNEDDEDKLQELTDVWVDRIVTRFYGSGE